MDSALHRIAIMPAVALAVVLLLARPRGAHANFFGSIESWWANIFGDGSPPASAGAPRTSLRLQLLFEPISAEHT